MEFYVAMIDMLASQYGWTVDEILNIRPYKLAFSLMEAIKKRMAVEKYEHLYGFAFLAAVNATIHTRKRYKPEDFLEKPGEEENLRRSIEELKLAKWRLLARKKGLREF